MALTFLNLQDIALDMIGRSETADRTRVKQFLNMAARDVWSAHPWRERRAEAFVNTVAPYSTGTVTATNGSTQIDGSGTTFTSAMAGRKFALSYQDPWYTVETYTNGTTVDLDRAYVETTASASTYVIYDDLITLATTADTLLEARLMKQGRDWNLAIVTEGEMDDVQYFPRYAQNPSHAALVTNASTGAMRLRLWPVPDAAYAIHYRYLKSYTDMSNDGDTCDVPESRRDLVLLRTLYWAYRYGFEAAKAESAENQFRRELERHWSAEVDRSPKAVIQRTIDPPVVNVPRYNFPIVDPG